MYFLSLGRERFVCRPGIHSGEMVAAESVFIFCLFWFRRSVIGSMLSRVCELSAPSLARLSAISFPLYPLWAGMYFI